MVIASIDVCPTLDVDPPMRTHLPGRVRMPVRRGTSRRAGAPLLSSEKENNTHHGVRVPETRPRLADAFTCATP